MEFAIVDKYLEDLSKCVGEARRYLRLYRQGDKGPIEITPQQAEQGYLKPDEGYGTKLNMYYVLDINPHRTQMITSWALYQFPSCCAFCVSTQAFVNEKLRSKGINTLSNTFRQELAKDAGYTALICTDIATNYGERITLQRCGFQDIFSVVNKRTKNEVYISVKVL